MISAPAHRRWLFWLAVGVLFFVFLFLIRGMLLPFVLGVFTAYFLDPAADRLEKHGASRLTATALITVAFFLGLLLLLMIVVPVIAQQLSALIADLPDYLRLFTERFMPQLEHWLDELPVKQVEGVRNAAADASGIMVGLGGRFLSSVFASGMAVVSFLSLFLITPVVSFYLLRDWDTVIARIDNLLPRAHAATIREQIAIVDRTLAGFLRGQLNVCLLLGSFYAIALSLIGLKFGILIGLATGFLAIVPFVGVTFGAGSALAIAFFQFDAWEPIAAVLGVFVVGQIIEGNFVTPKLVGEKVGLHPLWIIFGMLSGAALLGFVGILLAVPLTAVIGVLIRFLIGKYLQSPYYQGEPARK